MKKISSAEQWLSRLEEQLNLEQLMENCCQALLELSGADRCSIMVLDSDTDQLTVRWAQGSRVKPKGGSLKFRMGEGLCGWVARSQKAYCSLDATREPRFVPQKTRARKFRQVKTLCCLPLVAQGRTVGVVNLSSFSSAQKFPWIRQVKARRFLDRLAQVIAHATLLREAQVVTDRLRQQAKTTSETVAQVSHEVRTPLALMMEAAQQLLDGFGGPLTEEHQMRVQMIKSQADRMLRLVTELLDISRIEAGRLALQREELSLADVIQDVRSRYQPLVSPRTLKIETDSVPTIYGDRTRLTQVVENLLTNAVKFTPPNGSITVRLKTRGRSAELAVEDTGVGISSKDQKRLFQKFIQLKVPASLGARGTGLGLTIVKEVVHLHEGSVHVSSEQGQGTTFTVQLPLYTPSLALAQEFRVMREQAAREGRALAVQLLRAKPGAKVPFQKVRELLAKQVARDDRILEYPGGGLAVFSVLDASGLPAMRRRLEENLSRHPDGFLGRIGWGWALVPKEETTLPGVLNLAERRCEGTQAERAKT